MSDQSDEALEAYSKEIGLYYPLTLDRLIESHRILRRKVLKTNEELTEERMKERELMRAQLISDIPSEFISIDKLRAMTIDQLLDLIKPD